MGACSACRWMKIEMFEGRTFATCSHPKVKRHYPAIFCSVERSFESGCGIAGRFFEKQAAPDLEDVAASGASHDEATREIDLKGSRISWVEFVMQGRRKPF